MNDPQKYKLPRQLQAKLPTQYDDIRDFVKGTETLLTREDFDNVQKDHVAFLLYGFISITGISPDDCMLVERHLANGVVSWAYEKKNPKGDWRAVSTIKNQKKQIEILTKQLVEAGELITELQERLSKTDPEYT